MKELKKVVRLDKIDYYETHLSLVNCLLPIKAKMTPMEIKVLANFMGLEGSITQYRFGSSAKRIVKENLHISSAGLSNYMSSLTEKKIFIKDNNDIISIYPILIPEDNEQLYMFKLIKTNSNADTTTQTNLSS